MFQFCISRCFGVQNMRGKMAKKEDRAEENNSLIGEGRISIRSLIETCGDLGVKAGDILRQVHFQRLTRGKDGLKVFDKGAADGKAFDPQTIADRRSERLIVSGLAHRFGPGLSVVGEESGLASVNREEEHEQAEDEEDALREAQDMVMMRSEVRISLDWWNLNEHPDEIVDISRVCVWIDPLDATREYTEGHVQFCSVLIGITLDGRSVAGVMVEPFVEQPCLFWGRVGRGCFQTMIHSYSSTNQPRIALTKSTRITLGSSFQTSPSKDVRIIVSRSRQGGVVHQFTQRLTNLLRVKFGLDTQFAFAGGSGHKILQVLRGNADFYPFPCSGTSMWDACAGDALVEAAGGLLTDKRGERLVYDPKKSSYANTRGLLAAKDPKLCEYSTQAISCCLDYFRTVHFEFINEQILERMLRESSKQQQQQVTVLCVETPGSSLTVNQAECIVEMDLNVTVYLNDKRQKEEWKLKMRRFDPSPLFHEASSPRLDFLFAKRAAEVSAFQTRIALQEQSNQQQQPGKNKIVDGSTILSIFALDRTTSRRAPTVMECLAEERREGRANKMFLQACAYMVIYSPNVHVASPRATVEDQLKELKSFHESFLKHQSVAKQYYESGWRFLDLFPTHDSLIGEDSSSSLAASASTGAETNKTHDVPRVPSRVILFARDEEDEEADHDYSEEHDQQQRPLHKRGRRSKLVVATSAESNQGFVKEDIAKLQKMVIQTMLNSTKESSSSLQNKKKSGDSVTTKEEEDFNLLLSSDFVMREKFVVEQMKQNQLHSQQQEDDGSEMMLDIVQQRLHEIRSNLRQQMDADPSAMGDQSQFEQQQQQQQQHQQQQFDADMGPPFTGFGASPHEMMFDPTMLFSKDEDEVKSTNNKRQQMSATTGTNKRIVVLRGLFRESPLLLEDLSSLCVAVKAASEREEMQWRLLDVAHLLCLRGLTLANLEAVHRCYFSSSSSAAGEVEEEEFISESQLVIMVKSAIIAYLIHIVPSPVYSTMFSAHKYEGLFERIQMATRVLTKELDAYGRLNGLNLDLFTIGSSSSSSSSSTPASRL